VNPEDEILRTVVDPLPTPVERAWCAYDRVTQRIIWLLAHPPNVERALQGYTKEVLDAALSDGEPHWPSPVDVLAERQNLEAHETALRAAYSAQSWAEKRIGRAIVANERALCERLDDYWASRSTPKACARRRTSPRSASAVTGCCPSAPTLPPPRASWARQPHASR
jgi:hypothetical protein